MEKKAFLKENNLIHPQIYIITKNLAYNNYKIYLADKIQYFVNYKIIQFRVPHRIINNFIVINELQ